LEKTQLTLETLKIESEQQSEQILVLQRKEAELQIVINTKEEEISTVQTTLTALKSEKIELDMKCSRTLESLEEEKTKSAKLCTQVTTQEESITALQRERNDVLLKYQHIEDEKMNLQLEIADKVKLLKDKEDTMNLMEEAATDKLQRKDAELERIGLEVNGLKGEIALKEKEVEALNTQIKEMEVPAATEIRSEETEELIKKLTEQKHHETNLKQLAILKLEEVMNERRGTNNQSGKAMSDLRKKEREQRDLKRQLQKKDEDTIHLTKRHEEEMNKLYSELDTEKTLAAELKTLLAKREEDIQQLNKQIRLAAPTDGVTRIITEPNLESILSTPSGKNLKKANNWKRTFAVCNQTKLMIYDNEADMAKNGPCSLVIDLQSVNSVRAIEQGELWRISAKDVSKLFQISYCSEVEGTSADLDMSSVSVSGTSGIEFNGHHFMALPIADHLMTCELCNKRLKGIFKTEAYECQRCHYKVHKEHVEKEDRQVAPCKSGVRDLLLLAEDMNMRQKWVDRLNKNVKVPIDQAADAAKTSPKNTRTDYTKGLFRRQSDRPGTKPNRTKSERYQRQKTTERVEDTSPLRDGHAEETS